jgi:hypothetical protein
LQCIGNLLAGKVAVLDLDYSYDRNFILHLQEVRLSFKFPLALLELQLPHQHPAFKLQRENVQGVGPELKYTSNNKKQQRKHGKLMKSLPLLERTTI